MPGKSLRLFLSTLLIVFLVANIPLLFPSVWIYFSQYLREKLLTHHGYQMMGVLYYNLFSKSFNGTPFYYYLLYLVVKSPIPLLILFIIGLAHAYQGRSGIMGTTLMGLAFGISRVMTASLVPAVVWHACVDLVAGVAGPRFLAAPNDHR